VDASGAVRGGAGLLPMGGRTVLFDPAIASRVWVGSGEGGPFRSDDEGRTFTQMTVGLREVMVYSIATDGSDARVLWAARASGLSRSGAGGGSGTARTKGVRAREPILRVQVDGPRVWAATAGALRLSNDGGASFAPAFTNSQIVDFAVSGSDLYVGT